MKKKIKYIFIVGTVLLISGCAQMAWDKASEADSIGGYNSYLTKYPQGEFSIEASERIEKLNWEWACDKNAVKSYEAYLKQYPEGAHAQEARDRVEELIWKQAEIANSIKQYESYLEHFPSGKFVSQSKGQIEELIWGQALKSNTTEVYENYVSTYLKGKYTDDAKLNIETIMWKSAEEDNEIGNYEAYLDQYPKGEFAEKANDAIEKLFLIQQINEGTSAAVKKYTSKYPSGKYLEQAQGHIALLEGLEEAGYDVDKLESFIKQHSDTIYTKKAAIKAEQILLSRVKADLANAYIVRDIMPQDGHKGSITITGQLGQAYMTSPNYYDDGMVFTMAFGSNNMNSSHPLKDGSVWRFVGKNISLGDYVFSGEDEIASPLSFVLIDNVGFVHFRGSGTIKDSNGEIVRLGDK